MKGEHPLKRLAGAAGLLELGKTTMEIILHAGVHRTATTSFQQYLRTHSPDIGVGKTGLWGPLRTRKGMFVGLFPGPASALPGATPQRVKGRIALHLEKVRSSGAKRLLVTDENMIGSARQSVRAGALFPAIGERMARYGEAFDGGITQIFLTIRAQDTWWGSAMAYGVSRGHPLPSQQQIDNIAASQRSWRDVVTDLACAVPQAKVSVMTFEEYASRPQAQLARMIGQPAPADTENCWLNRSPDLAKLRDILAERGQDPAALPDGTGRWQPFDAVQTATMRETYADDLFWLAAGADGLATLTEDPTRKRAGPSLPAGDTEKGHSHDSRQTNLAHSG